MNLEYPAKGDSLLDIDDYTEKPQENKNNEEPQKTKTYCLGFLTLEYLIYTIDFINHISILIKMTQQKDLFQVYFLVEIFIKAFKTNQICINYN